MRQRRGFRDGVHVARGHRVPGECPLLTTQSDPAFNTCMGLSAFIAFSTFTSSDAG